MRNRRENLDDLTNFLNLDSLVDIISNNVGILVILAVSMAMLSLMEKSEQFSSKDHPIEDIEKIKIPWSHSSQKNNLLFLLKDDRLLYLDRALVFNRLKQYLSGKTPLPKQISFHDFSIKLNTGSGHAHCIEFFPYAGKGHWWYQVYQKDGLIQKLKKKFPPEENYFFFWVEPNNFLLFREIRESLWDDLYEVGWKPIRIGSALRYCSGNNQTQNFQPQ